jgi:hypothetical protein
MEKLALALVLDAALGSDAAPARQPPTPYTADAPSTTTSADLGRRRPTHEPGLGFDVFGAAGTNDAATWGLGGRLELVLPAGWTLGGSYQESFATNGARGSLRLLLGEIGMTLAVARMVEVRPMLGLGYAFVSVPGETVSSSTPGTSQSKTATVATAGFDVVPGAKISFLPALFSRASRGGGVTGAAFEVYTLPKYHFISGTRFLGVEVGAGARF